MAYGLGWAVAGQALTPFEDIAPNPWGPMLEVRQTPVADDRDAVDIWPDAPPLHFFLCDSKMPDGTCWDCCTRGFMKKALAALRTETGLQFMAAFEHEFLLCGGARDWCVPFSLEQVRVNAELPARRRQGIAGGQGRSSRPSSRNMACCNTRFRAVRRSDAMAGDRAIITREVIREAARRLGLRASFTPKPTPDAVGNGAHVHFSFRDDAGNNAAYDADAPNEHLAGRAAFHRRRGAAHAGAVRADGAEPGFLSPPRPASLELRLRRVRRAEPRSADPHLPVARARSGQAQQAPSTWRSASPTRTASPYMVIGALVNAGLAGVREKLPLPPSIDRDPGDLSEDEREKLSIVALPSSLAEALDVLEADELVQVWLSPTFYDRLRGGEAHGGCDVHGPGCPEHMCKRYHDAY